MKTRHLFLFVTGYAIAFSVNARAQEAEMDSDALVETDTPVETDQPPNEPDGEPEGTVPNADSADTAPENEGDDNPPWAESAPEAEPEPQSTTYLPPPPPPPDAEAEAADSVAPDHGNPCDSVSCSGRGTCVLQHGSPTCACRPGFVADQVNGLSCVAEDGSPAPQKRPAPPQHPVMESASYYQAMGRALLPYDIKPKLDDYQTASDNGTYTGSFSKYLRKSFKRTKNLATVALSFGILSLGGGLAMHMLYAGFPDKNGLLAGAVVLDLVGVGAITAGALLTALSTRRIRTLDEFEQKTHRRSARVRFLSPDLSLSANGAGHLGISFI